MGAIAYKGKIYSGGGASEMQGATADSDGKAGSVPKPLAGEQAKVLLGSGAWSSVGNATVVDTEGILGTAGATVRAQSLLDAFGGALLQIQRQLTS